MSGNNSAIGKEKVLDLLKHVLREIKARISVSFFNSSYGCRRKCPITEDFMRQFKDEFMFLTVEDDIKIQLKGDSNQPEIVLEEEYVHELKKILSKNSDKAESIKEEMSLTKSMPFKDFCDKFSSRKSVVSYPFLCWNSHIFKLRAADGETYVEIVEDKNVIAEPEFWKIVHSGGLKNVVQRNVLNFFRKFYLELDQGSLQICFNYGRSVTINKTFMADNDKYFEKTEKDAVVYFKLKEKYREPEESLVETETTTPNKNNNKDICKGVLNDVKNQNLVDEVTSTGDESDAKVESSVTNRESKSNSDNEFEKLLNTYKSSSSEADNDDINESSKIANKLSSYKAENIQEETQNQLSVSGKCENESTSGTSNKNDASSCLLNSELGEHAQTDETQKCDEKKKAGEEESTTMKEIRKALEENRSFIFVGDSDKDPILIGERAHSTEEKIKINHCLFKLKEKYIGPEESMEETTTMTPTENKDKGTSKEVLNEVKKQNPVDEVMPTEDESDAKVESSVMNRESKSDSHSESEIYSDIDIESSSSEAEDDDMNESSKKADKLSMYKAENIQEETQKQFSVSEKFENENISETSNKNDASSCALNSELEDHAHTDETQKDKEKRKSEEEESRTMKQIRKAIEENRSFIFVCASDKKPILIGERTRSTEGKKEMKKISQYLIEEL